MADLKQMLLTMHPNTKALAKAFANNILAGFAGEAEEVDAANPYGCNQYGEGWKAPHNGRASKQGAPVKKTDKVEEELPKLIGSTKQVEWAESIRENAMWYAEISGDSPERLPHMARIRTAKWWIDHRNDAMTLEQLKEAVAEDEKAFEEELEELERRGERARSWREYERKVRSGELKPFDPDGKLRRATDYLYSARADDTSRRRSEPIEMPDGTMCYTEDCNRHDKEGERNKALPNLPTSMEFVSIVPELENYGVPGGRVYIRRKLKGKFPIKGRMKNKKKAIGRFKKVLTPPYSVSKTYHEIDAKGNTHNRIDIIKTENGVTSQLVIQTSGDYAGGIVTYIDDISKTRMQKRTAGASTIR